MSRIDELKQQLAYHNHRYYVLDDPEVGGVEVARLGKRIYRDQLSLVDEQSGRRQYRIYGDSPDYERQDGTDLAAIAEGRVAVTPLHFDLTDRPGIETLQAYDLARLLAPAADYLG